MAELDLKDLKPNSLKSKEERETRESRPRPDKVTKGVVKTKKKSAITKLSDIFIAEDAENVKSYVVTDVIIPTIKNTILEVVRMFMFGGRGGEARKNQTLASKVSYRNFYDSPGTRVTASSVSDRFDYDDLEFETYADADTVLDHMDNILKEYNAVSVADMYDLVQKSAPWTANKYGWTDLHTARIVRVTGG